MQSLSTVMYRKKYLNARNRGRMDGPNENTCTVLNLNNPAKQMAPPFTVS